MTKNCPQILFEEKGDQLIITANNAGRRWLREQMDEYISRNPGHGQERALYDAIDELSAESQSNGGFHILDNDAAGFMTSALVWGKEAHFEDDGRYTMRGRVYVDPDDYLSDNQYPRLLRHGRAVLELAADFDEGICMPEVGSDEYNAVQDYRYQTCVPHLAPPGLEPPAVDLTPPLR
jgi:hypothetical protein